ncbi:hypothetical protein [Pararhizobium sp. LjRoot238]|uniref:hypothetical protein n=1 Tax=Pararhizobium sp. LjRoot238 TaxID=3342293 RepID=UPI003ECC3F8C
MWKLLGGAAALPLIVAWCAWKWDWPILPGTTPLTTTDLWSLAGTWLSYLGVLFSFYAAYEVGELAKRYFAKTRFPEIRGSLTNITTAMTKAANKRAVELRSERFISQIAVFLRSIGRIKGHKMHDLIKRAEKECVLLVSWMNDPKRDQLIANDATVYWDLFRTLNELSEEISAYLKEQEAK